MVATKLECKCHSGLSYNVISNSWAQLTAAWSVRTPQFASTLIENDSGVFPLGGENCGVSTHTPVRSGAVGYEISLVNLYKSSSVRQEKTRPVAILSTTLQHFRLYLNATCAVCARTNTGKRSCAKTNEQKCICRAFLCLLTCRCSWNRIGSIWAMTAGFLFQNNPWERKGEGDNRRNRGDLVLFVP